MSDAEISQAFSHKDVNAEDIRDLRLAMGLRRQGGNRPVSPIVLAAVRAEVEDGKTCAEVARARGLTRERGRQLAEAAGVHTGRTRTLKWLAARYKCPPLASKKLFRAALRELGGMKQFLQKCMVPRGTLARCAKRLGLRFRRKLRLVTLCCAQCRTTFKRAGFSVKRARSKGQKKFFCTKRCQGAMMGKGNKGRSRERLILAEAA